MFEISRVGSSRFCVISLTYIMIAQSLCPLWFLPLARQQDCILEYILPTKPKRAVLGEWIGYQGQNFAKVIFE